MAGWLQGRSLDGGIDEIPLGAVPGRLWLCGKHLVGPDPVAALDRVAADRMVCLCERHELEHRYPRYLRWMVEEADGRSLWFPTPDLGVRPDAATVPVVDRMVELLEGGEQLIVHCGAGVGRAGTLAVGVLLALGHDPDGAEMVVTASRPLAGPEAGAQRELIDRLALHYRRSG